MALVEFANMALVESGQQNTRRNWALTPADREVQYSLCVCVVAVVER